MNGAEQKRWLKICETFGQLSDSPHDRQGAVIVRPEHAKYISFGWDGAPQQLMKYTSNFHEPMVSPPEYTMHAPLRAVLNAEQSVEGFVLVSTLLPCDECAKAIVHVGIESVVAWSCDMGDIRYERQRRAYSLFQEAGVSIKLYHEGANVHEKGVTH